MAYEIPGYDYIERMGASCVTDVWKAFQVSVQREVCIKSLRPELCADPVEVERFVDEARNTSSINHPNIVGIYDIFEHDGQYHMVTEYVEGPTLDGHLRRDGALSIRRAFEVAHAMAKALSHVWVRHRLIHRNITPKSVILDSHGNVKLGYVGLSLRVDPARPEALLPEEAIEGTPFYMAPEQASGDQPLSTQTDMYGLGCTLYHAVTGRMPFGTCDPMEAIERQVTGQVPHPRALQPALNAAGAAVIERLMMKKPSDRYADWDAVTDALGVAASGRVVVVKGGGPAEQGGSTVAPYRKSAGASGKATESSGGTGSAVSRRPRVRIVRRRDRD